MVVLSDREKREMLEDAASAERRADFARLDSNPVRLTAKAYVEFLTWAAALSTEDAAARGLPVEKVMLL